MRYVAIGAKIHGGVWMVEEKFSRKVLGNYLARIMRFLANLIPKIISF